MQYLKRYEEQETTLAKILSFGIGHLNDLMFPMSRYKNILVSKRSISDKL